MAGDGDTSLVETNMDLMRNIEQIKRSQRTYEKEIQVKYLKLSDRKRTLSFFKQRMIDDLDFTVKAEIKNLADFQTDSTFEQKLPSIENSN
jgi:hypothetical protein